LLAHRFDVFDTNFEPDLASHRSDHTEQLADFMMNTASPAMAAIETRKGSANPGRVKLDACESCLAKVTRFP